ncbi:hypothetical protein C4D60_Mb11t17120 [Musa balbisiana]|uniref:leucine--tRNA ligase n=1 Tax=Musa balbisiana TaxID=52838 RepID=A0A4S8J4W9_MUSBA|nr:hypothetical protein C4D60_Mb11t17120 [Musa balbisiana]
MVFEVDAGSKPPKEGEKFFGNFPYPYMNGLLHLGHAFTVSKLEFAAAYHRLRGCNVLLPFAFHCTGMPIKTSADKLAREVELFGNPPVFPSVEEESSKGGADESKPEDGNVVAPDKFKSKRSKAAAKSGGYKSQWDILRSFGLSDDEIAEFQGPYHWLSYFPPLAKEDLKAFGLGCDWRRSFITTDMNPSYDSFVTWQMRKLKDMGKIMKDMRKVYLAAATLRPETMYGQTNAWVLPDGKYGAFEINETDAFIITYWAALNLAYQKLSLSPEKPTNLLELSGHDLIDKGTGIVTSVPSDSPDDFMALQDLKSKPALRSKFGVKDEWVLPFEVMPIINIPEFGDKSAEKVQEAKPLIRNKLLETGDAVMSNEPEKKVMSRSGDECVVALTDQWYITYGEAEWKKKAEDCLADMNLYCKETINGFEHTLSWLNQWACSRSFGLGTHLPWYEQFLVESLSNSTLYMAFYIIAHLLQGDDMYGSDHSSVKPEKMTDDVWDYIFCGGPLGRPRKNFSSDATRFSLADAGDGMDDANFVFETANAAILRLTKEITCMEEVLAVESTLRAGPPTTYADFVFANEINIAVRSTEHHYKDFMFREALKTGFYDIQVARDEYRDVWKNSLKKDGFVVNAGWPLYDAPDPTLKIANKYLQDSIVLIKKLLQKQVSGPKKAKKGATIPATEENKLTVGLIYVNEQFDGWKEECLRILQSKFDRERCSFAPDQEILEALKQGVIGQVLNFKQIQKLCMPFLKFNKDEALSVGPQALDLKLPFGEIQNPPSPGSPVAIFLSKLDYTTVTAAELEPKEALWKLFAGKDCCRTVHTGQYRCTNIWYVGMYRWFGEEKKREKWKGQWRNQGGRRKKRKKWRKKEEEEERRGGKEQQQHTWEAGVVARQ